MKAKYKFYFTIELQAVNMGIFGSSEENIEQKTIDTSGHVNNNVVLLQEAKDNHEQVILSQKLFYVSCLLVLFEIIKLVIFIFSSYKKKLKKAIGGNKLHFLYLLKIH